MLVYQLPTTMMKIENYNMTTMVIFSSSFTRSFLSNLSNIFLGNLIAPEISKVRDSSKEIVTERNFFFLQVIDPLPPIDHSEIKYAPFEKNFYAEHEDIRSLSNDQVNELRHKLGVNVSQSLWSSIPINLLFCVMKGSWCEHPTSSC